MVCIICNSETNVINSRHQKRTNNVWRRRKCLGCNSVFTTTEAIEMNGVIMVSSGKSLEAFQRDKLMISIHDALKHRKTALSDARGLTDTIISTLYAQIVNSTVTKTDITQASITVLSRFDSAAHTYYHAYHPN